MRIILHNHDHHKIYSHPLVRISGSIQCYNAELRRPTNIKVIATSFDCSSSKAHPTIWPIVDDNFSILVHLCEKLNRFKLWIEDEDEHSGKVVDSVDLCVRFEMPTKIDCNLIVRLVYVVCKDFQNSNRLFDCGQFEAPEDEDRSVESAARRISLGAMMSQCFFAETIGHTFQLELAPSGWPVVHQFVLDQTESELWSLSPEDIWKLTASELMKSDLAGRNCKYLAFAGFSRYRPNCKEAQNKWWLPSELVRGYVSLGGGGLALLSTHCLYTWPEALEDVPFRLTDDRPVDKSSFMDHSDNRNNHSGCYATTLGASIHELAHTFNLGHSEHGIMERKFNFINHFFLPQESLHHHSSWWTTSEASILLHHKWLNAQAQSLITKDSPKRNFTMDKWKRTITCANDLIAVEYRQLGTNLVLHRQVWTSSKLPSSSSVRCYNVQTNEAQFCDKEHLLFAMDCKGNILTQVMKNGSF